MLSMNEIPHLVIYKQKVIMPMKDVKTKNLFNMVILNNKNYTSIKDVANTPLIVRRNLYNMYYTESMYSGKIGTTTYRKNLRKERDVLYKNIESANPGITCKNMPSMVQNKNMYRDIFFNNEIFFGLSKKMTKYNKIEAYIEELVAIISDERFAKYTQTMIIDIASWVTDKKDTTKLLDNPVNILYFAMWQKFEAFKTLGNIDIIISSANGFLRINPSLCDENSFKLFKRALTRLDKRMEILDNSKAMEEMDRKEELSKFLKKEILNSYNLTGESDLKDDVSSIIEKRIDEIIEDPNDTRADSLESNMEDILLADKEMNSDIYSFINNKVTGKTTMNNKRDETLRHRQADIKIDGMTIADMRASLQNEPILETNDVSKMVKTTNQNITKIKYPNFDKTYNTKLYKNDIMGIFQSLNNKSIPVYILKVDIVDSSNDLNYKETWTVTMEDSNRVRHTIKVDMPKFVDDKFLYLNGNRKMIVRQLFSKPVVKTAPDTVQVVSNYNKIFIRREGQKLTSKLEKLNKLFATTHKGIVVKPGNVYRNNTDYITTIEYDECSKKYNSIRIGTSEFIFNQLEIAERLAVMKNLPKTEDLCVGFDSGKPIYLNPDSLDDVTDLMLSKLPVNTQEEFESLSVGKKFIYSTATIMKKKTPILFLLGFFEGLSQVLWKAEIEHYFTDKKPVLKDHQAFVRFKNGYLVYATSPMQNSLLMNAFYNVPTQAYDYEEFDKQDVYLDLFENIYGHKNVGVAFINYYNCMLDNITLEVLEKLNYPTDFVKLILFANSLLADNRCLKENNLNMYRIRSNEIVASLLYGQVADAYSRYLSSAGNNRPIKMSIPKDVVLKDIMMSVLTEDYSTLNPISESEKSRAITPKGPSGLNVKEAYTPDKRSFDPSMVGVIGMSTSPDANVGVVRGLTMEPNIVNARGYIDIKDDKPEELKDANLFSPAELLTPLGANRDDTIRTAIYLMLHYRAICS